MATFNNNTNFASTWPLTFKRFPSLFQSMCTKHKNCEICRVHRFNKIEENLQKNPNWNANGSLLGGVGAAILNNYYGRQWTMLTPKEKAGKYANQFNVCSGSMEHDDNGCFIDAAIREIREELRIFLNYKTFDNMFRGSNGYIRLTFVNGTPIFIGVITSISRKNHLNECIHRIALDQNAVYDVEKQLITTISNKISCSDCEISEIEFVVLGTKQNPENKGLVLSDYAIDVMNALKNIVL